LCSVVPPPQTTTARHILLLLLFYSKTIASYNYYIICITTIGLKFEGTRLTAKAVKITRRLEIGTASRLAGPLAITLITFDILTTKTIFITYTYIGRYVLPIYFYFVWQVVRFHYIVILSRLRNHLTISRYNQRLIYLRSRFKHNVNTIIYSWWDNSLHSTLSMFR